MNNVRHNQLIHSCRLCVFLATVLILLFPFVIHAATLSANTITGKLIDSEGNPPITSQTVFIADMSILSDRNSALAQPAKQLMRHSIAKSVTKSVENKNHCTAPLVPYKSYSCTNIKGKFTLTVPSNSHGSQHLAIVGKQYTLKINFAGNKFGADLGAITIPNLFADDADRVAIVSLSATDLNNKGHNLNTANNEVISYLFDSEILTGYGIKTSEKTIEYFTRLQSSADEESILDARRFSTILIKGSWQEILNKYSQTTVNKMLQFVEQGGTLLIKNGKSSSNNTSSIADQYI